MRTVDLTLPRPHAAQARIMAEAKRFNVVACGRRFGKSTMAVELAARPLLEGQPVGYFVPTYKLLLEYWRAIVSTLAPVTRRVAQAERRLELMTGGILECWTLEDENAGRSRKYVRAIIDEAGIVPTLGDIWEAAIRPTLADLGGDAWFLGTPKGRNFFWEAYQRGLDPERAEWACWQMPTNANPHIKPSEIEDMRRDMSELRYAQEVGAIFLEDSGGVFRGVRAAVRAVEWTGEPCVIGVDWARSGDFTVFVALEPGARAVVAVDRFTNVEYAHQRGRLRAFWERYGRGPIMAEANSMGGPVIEQLQREGLPVQPFTTTNASKAAVVDALALAFERRAISLPGHPEHPTHPAYPVLVAELEAFEATRLPSGLIRYAAPEGLHDDCVVALCLAWHAATAGQVTYTEALY